MRKLMMTFSLAAACGCGNFINDYVEPMRCYQIAAAVDNGYIYTSRDGGMSWVERQVGGAAKYWISIASSSNGTKIIAAEDDNGSGGELYISNDGGKSWNGQQVEGALHVWTSVSCSYSGNIIAAATGGGSAAEYVFISRDGGVNWHTVSGSANWTSVAVSGNGEIIYGAVAGNSYYIITWNGSAYVMSSSYTVGSSAVTCIATSYDGSVAAVVNAADMGVYVSNDTDLASSWVYNQLTVNAGPWYSVTVSGDGNRFGSLTNGTDLEYFTAGDADWNWYTTTTSYWRSMSIAHDGVFRTATGPNNCIWISKDAGISWTPCESSSVQNYIAVTVSKKLHSFKE